MSLTTAKNVCPKSGLDSCWGWWVFNVSCKRENLLSKAGFQSFLNLPLFTGGRKICHVLTGRNACFGQGCLLDSQAAGKSHFLSACPACPSQAWHRLLVCTGQLPKPGIQPGEPAINMNLQKTAGWLLARWGKGMVKEQRRHPSLPLITVPWNHSVVFSQGCLLS